MDKKRELTPEEMDRVSGGTGDSPNIINCPTCGCLIDINSSTCPACHALILNYNTNTNTDIAKV